jgi:CheY-like chemotaxis protein
MRGDATQIRQIIMNLVINASEAIGNTDGIITLTTGVTHCSREYLQDAYSAEELPEGLYVWLEVSDNGCGMDADTRSRIFEPFYTTKFAGRGLGLSAVLGIMCGHKGALKVQSEVGKGTTFRVLFPVEKHDELPAFKPIQMDDDWKGHGIILLVDDDDSVRTLGKRMLERLGFQVLTAKDGKEALQTYREQAKSIKLVLLDLTMPHMDGEETFQELQRIDPAVRVVMASGYAESEVSKRFAGKGLAGFVQKPYVLAGLKQRLRSACD